MKKYLKLDFLFYLSCCITFFMAGISSEYRFVHIVVFYGVTMLLGIVNVLRNYKNILENKNNIFIILYMFIAAIATALNGFDRLVHYAPSFICSACLVLSLLNKSDEDYQYNRKYIEILMVIFSLACNTLVLVSGLDGLFSQTAIISHKNVAGLINLVSFIICLNNIIKTSNNIDRLFYSLMIVINFVFMYLVKSRTSLLCAVIFFVLFIVYYLSKRVKDKVALRKYVIIFSMLFILGFIIFNKQVLSFVFKGEDINNVSFESFMNILLSGRYLLWFKAFPILFMNSPIIGNGIWTLKIVGAKTSAYLVASEVLTLDYLHNFIIDTLYVGGIVGFILLVIYFFNYFKSNEKNINGFVLINIIVMFIYFMFDNSFIWSPLFSNLFLFMELGYLIKKTN